MSKEAIPFVDLAQFLAKNHEEWLLDGFFITQDIYPYLQEQPNRISFYAIGLCQGGLSRTAIDLHEYDITAGSFMALKPNQLVNLLEIRDYVGMLLIFDKHFFLKGSADPELLESLQFFSDGATPVARFEDQDTRALLDEFINLRRRSTLKGHPYRREIARNLLVNLLYEADVLYRKQHSARD